MTAVGTFNPAYRVARCGQQSTHAPHVMEHGPDQPRNCPGVTPMHDRPDVGVKTYRTYLLPSGLGATKRDAHCMRDDPPSAGFYIEGEVVWIPLALLTEVKPPLPEEPPANAVVIDRFERAWQATNTGRGGWSCTVDDLGADWEELHADYGPLTLLVPDPFAEPVELPWEDDDAELRVRRSYDGLDKVVMEVDGSRHKLERDMAKALSRALWTAAANPLSGASEASDG